MNVLTMLLFLFMYAGLVTILSTAFDTKDTLSQEDHLTGLFSILIATIGLLIISQFESSPWFGSWPIWAGFSAMVGICLVTTKFFYLEVED